MVEQRRTGTAPEIRVRKALFAAGHRYRVGLAVPGKPRRSIDIAFTRSRLAVFIDGCFWHGCPVHFVPPASNAEWWAEKIAGNQARDEDTDLALARAGWTSLRLWEHTATTDAVGAVERALERRG